MRVEAIAEALRAERAASGLSQRELASRARISSPAYFRYERGDRSISVAQVVAICDVLGITFTQFARQVEERLDRKRKTTDTVVAGPWTGTYTELPIHDVPDWASPIAARDITDED